MSKSENPWAKADFHLENLAHTTFAETSQMEIDARLAAEAPDHPDSVELRRLLRESERSSEIATVLLLAFEMLLPRDQDLCETTARVAGYKAVTLLWMLQSQKGNLADYSLSHISKRLKVTRSLLSHYARGWNRATGLRSRGQKRVGTLSAYRESGIKGHATRRAKKAGLPVTDPAPVFVSLDQVDVPPGTSTRPFYLDDESDQHENCADGYSFDHHGREYDLPDDSDLE